MSILFENERHKLRPKKNFHSINTQRAVHRDILIFKKKPTRYTVPQIYFDKKTPHISEGSTLHHQESQHCVHSNRYLSC